MTCNTTQSSGTIGLVSLFLTVIGLGFNTLSQREVNNWSSDCGWNRQFIVTGSAKQNNLHHQHVYYDDVCKNNNDYCQTQMIGQVWLALNIIALILTAFGSFGMFYRTDSPMWVSFTKNSKYFFLSSSLVLFGAVIAWVAKNPTCYDTDHNWVLGSSPILVIISGIIQLFAAYLAMFETGSAPAYMTMESADPDDVGPQTIERPNAGYVQPTIDGPITNEEDARL